MRIKIILQGFNSSCDRYRGPLYESFRKFDRLNNLFNIKDRTNKRKFLKLQMKLI